MFASYSNTQSELFPLAYRARRSYLHPIPSDRQLDMDSLPQEIIDETIDNLPHSSLRSSALVAKQWRRRSQQRLLDRISFWAESKVNDWYVDTHNEPEGITSYVKFAKFHRITKWKDPTLFCRVLRNFSSLTELEVDLTEFPDEVMLECILRGEFGKNGLYLVSPGCSFSTMISMITALPNQQNLFIEYIDGDISGQAPSTRPALLQRRPLGRLRVIKCVDGVAQALANLHFASRYLCLDVQTQNIQYLLVPSLATVASLTLFGEYSLCEDCKIINDDVADFPTQSTSKRIDPSPFPALTSLVIRVFGRCPSPHLLNTLCSISPAPALTSIILDIRPLWETRSESAPSNIWSGLDRWLVQMAKNTTAKGGLVLILEEDGFPGGSFPGLKEARKIIPYTGTRH